MTALAAAPGRPRVGVVCDLVEEGWPSMELVADMLLHALGREHAAAVSARRIRPPLRRRFSAPPGRGSAESARRFNLDRLLNRFWDYPRLLRREHAEFDVYHLVDHSYGQLVHHLPAGRTVVTCHDLHTFRCLLDPGAPRRSLPFRLMTRHILSGLGKAAHVVFDTGAVRDEALAHGLLAPERTSVIPLGVHPACTAEPDPAADAEAHRLLSNLPPLARYILHVGGTYGRKRIDLLLRIFAEARRERPELRLVRVGGPFAPEQRRLAERLGVEDAILPLPFLERSVLAAVYRRAALVVLPSEEEGFGLPVLEAMTCGTPVVASDLAVLREVGGDAAVFCPVGEVGRWGETLLALLAEQEAAPERWAARRAAGLAQAGQFTWTEYARKMVDVYREVGKQ